MEAPSPTYDTRAPNITWLWTQWELLFFLTPGSSLKGSERAFPTQRARIRKIPNPTHSIVWFCLFFCLNFDSVEQLLCVTVFTSSKTDERLVIFVGLCWKILTCKTYKFWEKVSIFSVSDYEVHLKKIWKPSKYFISTYKLLLKNLLLKGISKIVMIEKK